MRDQLLKALLAHANGEIAMHKANVEIYLTNPVGIGEHSDITQQYRKSWIRLRSGTIKLR